MKNFVKALNRDGDTFKYWEDKFPRISEAQIKAGIFVGLQIRELFKDSLYFKNDWFGVTNMEWI
jgi:hypothetical protein